MKQFLLLAILFLAVKGYTQEITPEQWKEEAKTNIQLLPKYGNRAKSSSQLQSDADFIRQVMSQEEFKKNRTTASNHMIGLGFKYLYDGDPKTAMYRFNRAFLLDSTNSEIYLGYGAVYMTLGDFENAEKMYQEGLSINPRNTHLLTDYGTYFLGRYYETEESGRKRMLPVIDSAISNLSASYDLDKKDQNTVFKLSVCYWIKGDCGNAWKYYNECKALGGEPITEEYTRDLKKKCPQGK